MIKDELVVKKPPLLIRGLTSIGDAISDVAAGIDSRAKKVAEGTRRVGETGTKTLASTAIVGADLAGQGLSSTIAGAEYAGAKVAEARAKIAASSSKVAQIVWEKRPKTMAEYLLKGANALANIPTFYKLAFLICFYFFFYKIFYDIGIFFGLSSVQLILYMAWFGMLLFFVSFIKPSRSRLY